MKKQVLIAIGLSSLALAACTSADTEYEAEPVAEIMELEEIEAVAVPASLPEVRYYEVADV